MVLYKTILILTTLVGLSHAATLQLRGRQDRRAQSAPPTNSTNPCTLIAIVMDESGSMAGEQEFLRNDAMPKVISDLKLRLEKEVFVCTYGYGGYMSGYDPHFKGCSEGFDVSDYDFVANGSVEDGWKAIKFANEHVNNQTEIDEIVLADACTTTNKYLILVTDEDRDNEDPITFSETLALLQNNGWSVHTILDQELIPADALGTSDNKNGTYTYLTGAVDPVTNATTYVENLSTTSTIGSGEGTTEVDYVPLAFETDGTVWNLNKLRQGGFFAEAFAVAFEEDTTDTIASATALCRDVFKNATCTAEVTIADVNAGSIGTLTLSPEGPYGDGDVVTLTAELDGEVDTCTATITLSDPTCQGLEDACAETCDRFGETGTPIHMFFGAVCMDWCAATFQVNLFESMLQIAQCGRCPE